MRLFFIFICFIAASLSANNEVELQFLPNLPVEQTLHVRLEMSKIIGGIKSITQADQLLDSQVILHNDEGLPIVKPPFDMTFTPKKIKVDLNVNDETISIDSDRPVSSVYMDQILKIMGKPIFIEIDADGVFKSKQIDQILPVMAEFEMSSFLQEIFQPQFALMGQKLKEGREVIIKSKTTPQMPDTLTFKVNKINDQSVTASFKGKIKQKKIPIISEWSLGNKQKENVSLVLSGNMTGQIIWSRNNALNAKIEQNLEIRALIKIGDFESKMDAHLSIKTL